jgi:predicted alpha/beta superfamily hydrolase
MSNHRRLAFILALVLRPDLAPAQQDSVARYPRATIPGTEVRHVHSDIVGEDFEISVTLPLDYTPSDAKYPVLYLTDADMWFAGATQIIRFMQVREELPQMILVGIGYGTEDPREWRTTRRRDLTPTQVSDDELGVSGGAAAFLRFIREELMPLVNENYRTSSDNTLAGGSLGGLFALYALFHAPDTFQRYIIVSPSIWWGDRVTLEYEAGYAADHSDLPAMVFMSVGGLEEPPGSESQMISNMKELAERLRRRNYPSLHLETIVFDAETHVSVIAAATSRGLRVIYRDYAPR